MNYLDLENERLAYSRQETAKLLGVSPLSIAVLKPSRAIRRPLYSKAEIQE